MSSEGPGTPVSSWGAEHYSASHLSRAASVSADIRRAAVTARGYERMSGTAARSSAPALFITCLVWPLLRFPNTGVDISLPYSLWLISIHSLSSVLLFWQIISFSALIQRALTLFLCAPFPQGTSHYPIDCRCRSHASDGLETRDNLRGTSALTHLPHLL